MNDITHIDFTCSMCKTVHPQDELCPGMEEEPCAYERLILDLHKAFNLKPQSRSAQELFSYAKTIDENIDWEYICGLLAEFVDHEAITS